MTTVERSAVPGADGAAAEPPGDARLRRTLSTRKIVFIVVAAAAPLAAQIGTVPLAFALGDGPGVPAMFAFAGITLLCFSVGYAAMSRQIVNAGGFYTYISCGLGRVPAVAAGLIAVIAYNASAIGMAGAFAYFLRIGLASYHVNVPWEVWAAVGVAAVGVLGYRRIDFSANVLQVLMVCEIGVLAVLDTAILLRRGGSALPAVSFSPHTVFTSGIGVSMMFAFASFIGFESAALYGEETRDPTRSVPRATYISVTVIAVFYAFTSWVAVGAIGPSHVRSAAKAQLGNLFFNLSGDYLDQAATTVMQVLLCTSVFAGMLALHNAANRYMFVLGRDGVLPRWLDAVHPRLASPHRASLVQTAVTVLAVAAFAIAGLDPYLNLATSMLGLGTLGIIVLQALAALSVLGFFRRRADRQLWRTVLAPAIGFLGLLVSVVLLVLNFRVLTGTGDPVITALPWVVFATAVGGLGYGLWLRARRPERYAALAVASTRDAAEALAALEEAETAAAAPASP
jgi:amino acid transporter